MWPWFVFKSCDWTNFKPLGASAHTRKQVEIIILAVRS